VDEMILSMDWPVLAGSRVDPIHDPLVQPGHAPGGCVLAGRADWSDNAPTPRSWNDGHRDARMATNTMLRARHRLVKPQRLVASRWSGLCRPASVQYNTCERR
jgi:hypothetical protein